MNMDDTRLGGLAGLLSAGVLVPAFALAVTMNPGGGAERTLANFEAQPSVLGATTGLFLLTQALYIVFLAGLYRSVKGSAYTLARISFGIGVFALVLGMLSIHLMTNTIHALGPSRTTGSLAGTDLLEVIYLGLSFLGMAGGTASILFVGLALFGFGVAMLWDLPFGAPFAYATMLSGIFVFASVLLFLFPLPVLAMYGYGALGGAVLWGHKAEAPLPNDAADTTG